MSEFGVGEIEVPDGYSAITGRPQADLDVAIVASRFNADTSERLLKCSAGVGIGLILHRQRPTP